MNLNEKFLDRWAAALESGKYPQAKGALCVTEEEPDKDGNVGFCCLGVACELLVEDGIFIKRGSGAVDYGTEDDYKNANHGHTLPPASIVGYTGLEESNPYFLLPDEPDRFSARHPRDGKGNVIIEASELNDEYGFTFSDIAKLIRERRFYTEE